MEPVLSWAAKSLMTFTWTHLKEKKKGFSGKVLIEQELKCPVHQIKVKCDASLLNAVHKGEMFLETMALKNVI